MLNLNTTPIKIGDKVLVAINNQIQELEIVALPQGNLKQGKVSFLAPVAQALLGKRPPQTVTVKLPNGNQLDCRLMKVAH